MIWYPLFHFSFVVHFVLGGKDSPVPLVLHITIPNEGIPLAGWNRDGRRIINVGPREDSKEGGKRRNPGISPRKRIGWQSNRLTFWFSWCLLDNREGDTMMRWWSALLYLQSDSSRRIWRDLSHRLFESKRTPLYSLARKQSKVQNDHWDRDDYVVGSIPVVMRQKRTTQHDNNNDGLTDVFLYDLLFVSKKQWYHIDYDLCKGKNHWNNE